VRDRLNKLHQADIDLVAGGGGVFEITLDGQLVFSKKSEGRFPTDDELQSLAAKLN
jgi:selT/selW/selH-like putative selenoprotein